MSPTSGWLGYLCTPEVALSTCTCTIISRSHLVVHTQNILHACVESGNGTRYYIAGFINSLSFSLVGC